MAMSQQTGTTGDPAPNFLAHLEQAFGWSPPQACDALGAYLMSTKAGRALRHDLEACNRSSRAA
jgi:hypothetical protein